MSLLVVGVSHHTAPLAVLERCALSAAEGRNLAEVLLATDHVSEAAVLATCNRLEVYAEVDAFHGGLVDVGTALVSRTGLDLATLTGHMYAHFGEHAVSHLFTVTCGLDSMAIGESQVLGQVRDMLQAGQQDGTVARGLDPLLQQALRVGKRAFSETGLAGTGHNLVDSALGHAGLAGVELGLAGALVIGAGSMSALAASRLRSAGIGSLTVANRSAERARRLADNVDADWLLTSQRDEFLDAMSRSDVVVTCTGAVGHVLDLRTVVQARERRAGRAAGRPAGQLVIDLALPRDVAPEVGQLPGVTLVDLAGLGKDLAAAGIGDDLEAVRGIVRTEVEAYTRTQRAQQVAPTVVALRQYAARVVDAELERLQGRLGPVDAQVNAEIERTVHRVVDKLLHTPTVRVKSLSAAGDGSRYAEALAQLFDLKVEGGTGGASVHDVSALLTVGDLDGLGVGVEAGAGRGGTR